MPKSHPLSPSSPKPTLPCVLHPRALIITISNPKKIIPPENKTGLQNPLQYFLRRFQNTITKLVLEKSHDAKVPPTRHRPPDSITLRFSTTPAVHWGLAVGTAAYIERVGGTRYGTKSETLPMTAVLVGKESSLVAVVAGTVKEKVSHGLI